MESDHRRSANQANAKLSTGPKTGAGKARSSRNALRHGLNLSIWNDTGLGARGRRNRSEDCRDQRVECENGVGQMIGAAQVDIMRIRSIRRALLKNIISDNHSRQVSSSDPGLASPDDLAPIFDQMASQLMRIDRYEAARSRGARPRSANSTG